MNFRRNYFIILVLNNFVYVNAFARVVYESKTEKIETYK